MSLEDVGCEGGVMIELGSLKTYSSPADEVSLLVSASSMVELILKASGFSAVPNFLCLLLGDPF